MRLYDILECYFQKLQKLKSLECLLLKQKEGSCNGELSAARVDP